MAHNISLFWKHKSKPAACSTPENNTVTMRAFRFSMIYLPLSWLLQLQHVTFAITLVRRGTLVSVNLDTSDLVMGGVLAFNSAGNACSSNTYYDDCPGTTGTRVYTNGNKGAFYILSAQQVTYCGRWRRESNCQTCNSLGCTVTTPIEYGGSTWTQNLLSSSTEIAALSITRNDNLRVCDNVCTNQDELIFPTQASSTCVVANGWTAVPDDYSSPCVERETCSTLVVNQGCENTDMGSVAGNYRPLSANEIAAECSDSYVDATRSVYKSSEDGTYLFYRATQDEWVFSKSFCSSLGNKKGFFDAGNEPFSSTEAEVQCYDGGFTSNKEYNWTPLSMTCTQKSGGIENKGGLGTDGSSGSGGGNTGIGGLAPSASSATKRGNRSFCSTTVLVSIAAIVIRMIF